MHPLQLKNNRQSDQKSISVILVNIQANLATGNSDCDHDKKETCTPSQKPLPRWVRHTITVKKLTAQKYPLREFKFKFSVKLWSHKSCPQFTVTVTATAHLFKRQFQTHLMLEPTTTALWLPDLAIIQEHTARNQD